MEIAVASETIAQLLSNLVPILAFAVAIISVVMAAGRGKLKIGSLAVDFDRTALEDIRSRLKADQAQGGSQQYALLREYHAQGLAQSRISFWFSLAFASVGFAVIAVSIGIFLQSTQDKSAGWLDTAGKPIFTLVAGTVIDAVAALFFVQSNKARQLMTAFFDKLRIDRKLDEALKLANAVSDPKIASNLKALLSLNFAEVIVDTEMFQKIIGDSSALKSVAASTSSTIGPEASAH